MVPYWSLYLEDSGFSPAEIGVLGAIMMSTKVLSPYLWGWLADRTGQRMAVIRGGSIAALLSFAFIYRDNSFSNIALVVAAFTFFWNAVLAQFEVVTLSYLQTQFTRYSSIRLWGSIGFIVAVGVLGVAFDIFPITYLPAIMLCLLAGIGLSSLLVAEPIDVRQPHESTVGLRDILAQPVVIVFFLICFLLQLAHGPYYTFYSIYLQDYGFTRSHIGALWALGVGAEVLVFVAMQRIMQRYTLRQIMLFSLLVSVVRWLLIAFFPNVLPLVIVAQLGHAATFGSFHAIAVEIVRRLFGGQHQGQGQALYSAISFGAGGAIGALISGYLWSSNPTLTWVIASVASFVALTLALVFIDDRKIPV